MDSQKAKTGIDQFWESEVLPTISKYIQIPNQSPLFDPNWKKNGHMNRAIELVRQWVEQQQIPNSRLEIHEAEGRTPVLFLEVAGQSDSTVLLYGHLDKQPAMIGWEDGLGPWTPVRRDGKLFGRGAADDGYAVFACVSAIKAMQEQGVPHSRLVVLIECCEESGSVDLPFYVEKLNDRIGTPGLVICLDSGCGNYEALWSTASLRGSIVGNLTAEVLTEGVHSGDASGIVPSSFRILRILLDRLEDAKTGQLLPEWLYVEVPENRMVELKTAAQVLKDEVFSKFPFVPGMSATTDDPLELLLNRNWRPSLSYTGQDGMPDLVQGGNVLRPRTSLKLSVRLPPTLDATMVDRKLKELLESDPPYGAKVTFEAEKGASGWQTPPIASWLEKSVSAASLIYFGGEARSFGEGGSIPFMGMLGERFPNAQFLITGVLGPHSNAHGPNEFLHIAAAKGVTACVAKVLADYHQHTN
ncbi:MAG TPA: M20 family metallopeptidase [Thermoanaerobaculia bacterium]|nr:M20 family metallopeptidase [Thermoanaerobaculia bacterium]